ncbi:MULTISPECIES: DUF4310 family protein [unclassified Brevibacillus]|jgi:uncharacterized protein (TIGR03579 family)|uniref:DUF4310 family protein n=1 Tax=unclassified Brevibacillus TaxID=2684853 RepID=UPI000E3B514F|nr:MULTISPECIES: DUF4310 family protein [unclassified Brevibacillus]MBR8660861.1 DUF4310 family protein [Brevibacillus sp. NL20B1]NNV03460.1 DUF4310 family protein [Brevibacillus sp. MCWH]REK63315.1 MAG: hypothetical protein DF221_10475 [Brevibacillus sp.]
MNEGQTKGFWYSEWAFPLFVACLSSGIFAGTHLYYVYHVGAFNDIAIVAMLEAGIKGGGYGAAAAFGASFLFARVLEGPLVGILDIGGSLQTGIGIGVPALMLSAGMTAPLLSFPLALVTGALLGLIIGAVIVLIRTFTINAAKSTFGADVMMGAGNAAGRYLGPLIVISAIMASIPVGIGATIGAAVFYYFKKPIAGGAIIGAMILGAMFPIPPQ